MVARIIQCALVCGCGSSKLVEAQSTSGRNKIYLGIIIVIYLADKFFLQKLVAAAIYLKMGLAMACHLRTKLYEWQPTASRCTRWGGECWFGGVGILSFHMYILLGRQPAALL